MRDAVAFIRNHGGVVFVRAVARGLGIHMTSASLLLALAVLSGKVRNLDHQKDWIAV